MIITIDGPIATGKSTIAKRLAEEISFIYFDTGAMYRCITYAILKNNIDVDNDEAIAEFLKTFKFDVKIYYNERRYLVDDEDVTDKIRNQEITSNVSRVSAKGAVRDTLVALQRELSQGVNAVFEGRDMGTTVFPQAKLKIYLTGKPEIRAKRRFEELRKKFPEDTKTLTVEKILEEINLRDKLDSTRELSPLKKADDAYVIDTSEKTLDEIIYEILEYKDSTKSKTRHQL